MKVYLVQSFSTVVDVDAATIEEAIERAPEIADFTLCHECNGRLEQDGEATAMVVYDDHDTVIWDQTTSREGTR